MKHYGAIFCNDSDEQDVNFNQILSADTNIKAIKILLSDLTIFGAENRAKMTVLGSNLMEGPNWLF